MLGILPLSGAIVTADAMFAHADFAALVLEGGDNYILPLRRTPRLLADVAQAFQTPGSFPTRQRGLLEAGRHSARPSAKGARPTREAVADNQDDPGGPPRVARASRLTRERAGRGGTTTGVAYGVTSLGGPGRRDEPVGVGARVVASRIDCITSAM